MAVILDRINLKTQIVPFQVSHNKLSLQSGGSALSIPFAHCHLLLQERIFSLYDTDQDEVPVTSPVVRRVRKSGIEGADVKPDKRTTLFIAD